MKGPALSAIVFSGLTAARTCIGRIRLQGSRSSMKTDPPDIGGVRMEHRHSLRDAVPADADAIAAIYNHYVETTPISMETDPVTPDEMARRIAEVQGGA